MVPHRPCTRSRSPAMTTPNRLHFGDCLDVMRERIDDESVDLIYLDPPFKSDRNYNLLFGKSSGGGANAHP